MSWLSQMHVPVMVHVLVHCPSEFAFCKTEHLQLCFQSLSSTRFCITTAVPLSVMLVMVTTLSHVAVYRYEIDKLTASQRLDLNLEKGRMRDELQALRDKANELEIKMDKETNSLKAAVEQTKNETIKYCLGMMLAFTTAGLGAARLVSH